MGAAVATSRSSRRPSAHGGGALEGPAGVELVAQRSGSGDEQVAELAQRGGAGLDGAVSGDAELADRLDDAGGVGGGCGRFAREHLAGSGLSVDGVVLAATRAQMRVRLVDLDHSTALIDQRPGQSRTKGPGGLDTDRGDRAERREPCVGQAVAGTGRRERLCAQYSPERVERRGDTEVGVAVNPADHRLLWIWHAVVGHLGAAGVPGRDGHNSDEASVGAGSYEVTSLVPDRPQLASRTSRPPTSTLNSLATTGRACPPTTRRASSVASQTSTAHSPHTSSLFVGDGGLVLGLGALVGRVGSTVYESFDLALDENRQAQYFDVSLPQPCQAIGCSKFVVDNVL